MGPLAFRESGETRALRKQHFKCGEQWAEGELLRAPSHTLLGRRQNSLVWLMVGLPPDVNKAHIPVELRSPVDTGTNGDALCSLELSGVLLATVASWRML